jgi:hypothetical protein
MEPASDRFTKLAGTQVTKWRWAIGLQGVRAGNSTAAREDGCVGGRRLAG